ncbi:hypothetical protein PO380_22565 [Klebsiella oxytoca]|uniref:glycosyltransferase family protein n=1 Tax=Klebsiella oxytoca TaxID=571 RepID=UPI002FFC4EB8
MKRILILSHTQAFSDFKIGSHHYANGLSEFGYEVYYSGISDTIFHKILKKEKGQGGYKLNKKVKNLQIKSFFPMTLKNNILIGLLNALTYKLYNENKKLSNIFFDVIVCDFPFFAPILSKLKYRKLVYRPTDDYVAMMGDRAIFYEDKICHLSDVIVATSDIVSENIKERFKIQKKINVISNGYDDRHFYCSVQENSLRRDAIYVGALDFRFDFEALKFLANNNKKIKFDIFGPITEEFSKKICEFEPYKNVFFHNKIDYEDTNLTMNKYRVGLLLLKNNTSNKGRSPMKLWEYIASGLNVVYSSIDGVQESAKLFKYGSFDEMVLLFDEAYRSEVMCDDLVLKNHSWSSKVRKINELLIDEA